MPKREPDIILPEIRGGVYETKIWVKENIYAYNKKAWNAVLTADTLYDDVIDFLEHTIKRCPSDSKRVEAAMNYLAERELLDV